MGWGWSLEGGRERKARSGLFQGVGSCAVRGISSSGPPPQLCRIRGRGMGGCTARSACLQAPLPPQCSDAGGGAQQ